MHNKGFTLIELLVVIAIIGLLSSVVLASLESARLKAQDSKRLSELKAVQLALGLYYDANGRYPAWNQTAWGRDCSGWRGTSASNNTFLQPLVDGGFLATPIQDPSEANCRYQYRDENSGQGYRILFHLETNNAAWLDSSCFAGTYWACIGVDF